VGTTLVAKRVELLVDGDIILHRFGHSAQMDIDWGGDEIARGVACVDEVTQDVKNFLQAILQRNKAADLTICFSGPRNFRYAVLPSYKWNRKGLEKPVLFGAIKSYLIANYLCLEQDKLEGDDLMGIISTGERGKHVICSIDKDMRQIPGKHYNWTSNKKTTVTKAAADLWFYTQILTGDPGDGYTGIPGVGPKKAEKILEALVEDCKGGEWAAIVSAYEFAGLTEANAIQQAQVARILRHGEYNFDTQEIKLWVPSQD
jgi:DNA polymerase-1